MGSEQQHNTSLRQPPYEGPKGIPSTLKPLVRIVKEEIANIAKKKESEKMRLVGYMKQNNESNQTPAKEGTYNPSKIAKRIAKISTPITPPTIEEIQEMLQKKYPEIYDALFKGIDGKIKQGYGRNLITPLFWSDGFQDKLCYLDAHTGKGTLSEIRIGIDRKGGEVISQTANLELNVGKDSNGNDICDFEFRGWGISVSMTQLILESKNNDIHNRIKEITKALENIEKIRSDIENSTQQNNLTTTEKAAAQVETFLKSLIHDSLTPPELQKELENMTDNSQILSSIIEAARINLGNVRQIPEAIAEGLLGDLVGFQQEGGVLKTSIKDLCDSQGNDDLYQANLNKTKTLLNSIKEILNEIQESLGDYQGVTTKGIARAKKLKS